MGCNTSASTQLQQQILPLPIDIINAYIDRVSIVMINKIKDKFQSQLTERQYEMDQVQFIHLFKHSQISDNSKRNLFGYFSNNNKRKLPINKFIQKYCILIKSDSRHFNQIIHRIYCKTIDSDKMLPEDYTAFEDDCLKYFNEGVSIPLQKFPLLWSHFFEFTKEAVNWQNLQKSLQIVSIDELPFKSFHQELEKFNTELLRKGTSYFIVSAQWISQWIFFYEYEDTDIKNSSYRSNKSSSLLRKKSLAVKRKISKPRLNSSKIISGQKNQNMQSFLPSTQINFTEIEGEYYGQLKPLLIVERDIAIINAKMWEILKNTLGSTIQFERQAIDEFNVDLYPLFVYFYRVESNGTIDHQSLEIFKAKRTLFFTQFKRLLPQKKNSKQKIQNPVLYYKNFEAKNFTEWNPEFCLQQFIQQHPRTIIIQIPPQLKKRFTMKYDRQELKNDNITIGDKVLAYFSYQDKFIEAYVINSNPNKKQFKVHFIGYSYNYQRWVKNTDLKLVQNQTQEKKDQKEKSQVTNEKEIMFWGIPNIGNTCFLNSVLQSLVSTSIFDKFLLKANLSQKKYPLSFALGKVVKGILNRQKFNIADFKKIVNTKMPIFSGYDQHDAQEFLNLLLDNMDEQLKQKPNIVDELFCGVMESKFTCLKCKEVKTKQQKIHSISLPIPQNEFNYFIIMIFPIYSASVRKIILRLHKTAKISEYLSAIQQRSGINRFEFLFVEAEFSTLKKFRNQLTFQINEDKRVTDLGLNSNIGIWAFEKLRNSSIAYQLKKKISSYTRKNHIEQGSFYDYYSNEQASWGITKVVQIMGNDIKVEFLKENYIKQLTIKKQQDLDDQFNQLGTKVVERVFRRVFMRRWSESASKMVFFESELFIGLPKWVSYKDSHSFFYEFLQNIRRKNSQKISKNGSIASNSFQDIQSQQILFEDELRLTGLNSSILSETNKPPYVIHFLQPQKNCCFFCLKQSSPFHNVEEIKLCCEPEDKQIPLYWITQQKALYFVIDWVDVSEYNESYYNSVEMDNASVAAEQKMKSEKISLQQCLDLWKKPQKIEMQCQKCKFQQHLLETSIKKSPIITVFHLKQFRYTQEGHFIKLNINLEWIESINLQEYYSDSTQKTKGSMYEMYSVITHKGNTNSGHYTSMAKRKHPLERTKVWVNFDDMKTDIISEKPQNIENAYLLFFKKVDIPSSAVVHFSI